MGNHARQPIRLSALLAGGMIAVLALMTPGCMRYLTHERQEVLLEGVSIDQSLRVAHDELHEGGWGSVLTLWAIRDQYITPPQAARVSELYFAFIDSLERDFNVWHLTWAVANMYRHGDQQVKEALRDAYEDARVRAREQGGLADKHVNGERLYMGDAHIGGRAYAHNHVVVPGNEDYLQSYHEYRNEDD
jgi:hypothetical protein